jgi:uncharacterized protein (DUF433 family)
VRAAPRYRAIGAVQSGLPARPSTAYSKVKAIRVLGVNIHKNIPSRASLFTSDPEIMGGRLVFRGTRIPVEVLFENLADGMSLDDILDAYPGLEREAAVAAIELAGAVIEQVEQTRNP